MVEKKKKKIQELINRVEALEHEIGLKQESQTTEKALVCPRCNKKDITLISESKKEWWCNLCKQLFSDLF